MKRILLVSMAAVLPLTSLAQSRPQDERYIVTFKSGDSQADKAQAVRQAGASLRHNYSIIDAAAISVTNSNALNGLQRNPAVVSITRDLTVRAVPAGRDVEANGKPGGGGGGGSSEAIQPGVLRVGVPTANSNGADIGIAIVDTGIDLNNVEFTGAVHADQYTAFSGTCQDDEGHGTHVAGIAGARANGVGTVGVAPNATLYCAKVLDQTGSGSDSDVIGGLQFVLGKTTIRVVNMSLGRDRGTDEEDAPMQAAIKALYDAGVSVVVSAGNDAAKEISSQVPARFPEVLAIASTTAAAGANAGCRFYSGAIAADTASFFTTDGAGVAVSAPGDEKEDISRSCFITGVGVLSTKLGGGTVRMSGTSMASPHVAGVVARMLQKGVASTPAGIRSALAASASGKGTAPKDSGASSYTSDGTREGIAQAP